MKTLLPQPILDILNTLDDANRGPGFSAIFDLIYNRVMPEPGAMTPAAYCVFQFYLREMGRKIERYHAAADRREKRKAEKSATAQQTARESENIAAQHENKVVETNLPDYIMDKATNTMTKVVKLALRQYPSNKTKRDRKIKEQLQKKFPGLFADISYTNDGNVVLKPAC